MKTALYKYKIDKTTLHAAALSRAKGAHVDLYTKDNRIFVTCTGYGRSLGRLEVEKMGDEARIVDIAITEKDFYPYEAMTELVIQYLRKAKVKYYIS